MEIIFKLNNEEQLDGFISAVGKSKSLTSKHRDDIQEQILYEIQGGLPIIISLEFMEEKEVDLIETELDPYIDEICDMPTKKNKQKWAMQQQMHQQVIEECKNEVTQIKDMICERPTPKPKQVDVDGVKMMKVGVEYAIYEEKKDTFAPEFIHGKRHLWGNEVILLTSVNFLDCKKYHLTKDRVEWLEKRGYENKGFVLWAGYFVHSTNFATSAPRFSYTHDDVTFVFC